LSETQQAGSTVVETTMELSSWLRKQLEQASPELLRAMVRDFAEALMGAEADGLCGAGYGERSPERVTIRKRLPRARLGHAGGHERARDPEAETGQLLP
jgi:putative transposase